MTLIPEIDEHACRDDARNLLKKYLWQARIASWFRARIDKQ